MRDEELAGYFQVPPEILRFVPELLADLWELGSDPALVVEWLRGLELPADARVLELGCGKGANVVTVALKQGLRAEGVEAFPPFVEEARRRAQAHGVAHLCAFRQGDLREEVRRARGFDVVLFLSVGGVLGGAADTVGALRQVVRPGGYVVLDDAYRLGEDPLGYPGYGHLERREEVVTGLQAHGDTVLREQPIPVAAIRAQNERYTALITARAEALARRHGEHAEAFRAYVREQERECEVLETRVQCVTWLLRRRG